MSEVVQIIGKNIGKPDLRNTQAPDEQVRPALSSLACHQMWLISFLRCQPL